MDYDIVVIGSGPGGYVAALHGARLGAKVCCVESAEVGGTCLNRGCIPTKYLMATGRSLAEARRLGPLGISLGGEIRWDAVLEGKNKVVSIQTKGIESLFKSWGVDLIRGRGALQDRSHVRVEFPEQAPRVLSAGKIILATGSSPAAIPGLSCDGKRILNSDHILETREIPRSIIIVGAGAIGSEFACLFHTLGARVTMVEMMARPLPLEDEEISALFARELKKKQIDLHVSTKIASLLPSEQGVTARFEGGQEVSADIALVAIGRRKNTAGIGLESVGLTALSVTDRMETQVPGIYAIGDAVGKKMLAHVASHEGIVAAHNALGHARTMEYRAIPATTFTDPEVASVGLTETAARADGRPVVVGRFPFRSLGKAHAVGEITGLVKIIADEGTGVVLGAHIMGGHATEIIHELALAVTLRATLEDIEHTIHSHPTFAEAIPEAAGQARGRATHTPREK